MTWRLASALKAGYCTAHSTSGRGLGRGKHAGCSRAEWRVVPEGPALRQGKANSKPAKARRVIAVSTIRDECIAIGRNMSFHIM